MALPVQGLHAADCQELPYPDLIDAVRSAVRATPTRRMGSRTAQTLRLDMELRRVSINRPWLDLSLLTLSRWSLPGRAPGSLSDGVVDSGRPGLLKWIPIDLIAIRDLQITARWSDDDAVAVRKVLESDAPSDLGPFRVDPRGTTFSDGTLQTRGIQIFGWLVALVPAAPPAPVRPEQVNSSRAARLSEHP